MKSPARMLEPRVFPPQPPQGFRPAGLVERATFCLPPPIHKMRYTGSRLLGVKYEAKVQEYLQGRYGERYVPNPWMVYYVGGQRRWCQPDGLLFNWKRRAITIVEVKYQHTSQAWWQVMKLYLPVLQAAFPPALWEYYACEVVKWYDAATGFPVLPVLAPEVEMLRPNTFTVHIWKS